MSGGYSGSTGGENTHGGKTNGSMNRQKQNKHVPGTKEYQEGKSTIDISLDKLEELVKDNIKNGTEHKNGKISVDLGTSIGTWVAEDGKTRATTSRVTIHNSKTGWHAVPAKPNNWRK